MALPAAHNPSSIPYSEASPAQLSQAIITAREALDPYYPNLTWPQWHQAFRDLGPSLKSEEGRFVITYQSLSELIRHLETMSLHLGFEQPVQPVEAHRPKTIHRDIKKTYSIRPEILEHLNRVSFWRRERKSALVNLALTQLLSQYSESQIPIPE